MSSLTNRGVRNPQGRVRGERRALVILTLILISAFGPYVSGGIRTEQIAVYASVVVALPLALTSLRLDGGKRFIVPWILYIAVALLGVIFPSMLPARWEQGSLLAGLDNILGPLAIMIIVWSLVPSGSGARIFEWVGKLTSVALALNGALAILATRVDLSGALRPFWGEVEGVVTTAELAAQLGRFGGVFNQPAEAGTLYGIAGLIAIYVWKNRPALLIVVLLPIIIGGLISVSKIFVLGGLPLILLYWLRTRGLKSVGGAIAGVVVVGLGVTQSGLLDKWTGFGYLARLINPNTDGGALAFYTAGRTQADSSVALVVNETLRVSPLSGVGVAGWQAAYDSFISESMVVGGLLGLMTQLVVLGAVFALAHQTIDPGRRALTYLIAIQILGASLGFSPLTANRSSTILWMVLALLVVARRDDHDRDLALVVPSHEAGGSLGPVKGSP